MDLAFPEQDNSEALTLRKSSIKQTIETAYSSVCWLVRQTNMASYGSDWSPTLLKQFAFALKSRLKL
jgi:hypothetical protein